MLTTWQLVLNPTNLLFTRFVLQYVVFIAQPIIGKNLLKLIVQPSFSIYWTNNIFVCNFGSQIIFLFVTWFLYLFLPWKYSHNYSQFSVGNHKLICLALSVFSKQNTINCNLLLESPLPHPVKWWGVCVCRVYACRALMCPSSMPCWHTVLCTWSNWKMAKPSLARDDTSWLGMQCMCLAP